MKRNTLDAHSGKNMHNAAGALTTCIVPREIIDPAAFVSLATPTPTSTKTRTTSTGRKSIVDV
jgi:hypothetical protein